MIDERDETPEADVNPDAEIAPGESIDAHGDDAHGDGATSGERRALTSGDFLVPGPSPESNEGLGRWGLTWLAFSLLLIVLMLCVSFACLTLANWTGVA